MIDGKSSASLSKARSVRGAGLLVGRRPSGLPTTATTRRPRRSSRVVRAFLPAGYFAAVIVESAELEEQPALSSATMRSPAHRSMLFVLFMEMERLDVSTPCLGARTMVVLPSPSFDVRKLRRKRSVRRCEAIVTLLKSIAASLPIKSSVPSTAQTFRRSFLSARCPRCLSYRVQHFSAASVRELWSVRWHHTTPRVTF